MSMKATKERSPGIVLTSLAVVDFGPSPPCQFTPKATVAKTPWWKSQVLVQWVAIIVLAVVSLWPHFSDSAAKTSDEHVGNLIEGRLQPAVKDMDSYVDRQLVPINGQLANLNQEVGQLQGRFQQLDSKQKKLTDQIAEQGALARLEDPRRILATIREEIQMAEQVNRPLQKSDLADYRMALQGVSTSTADYWTTVAAVINYQSLLNQMSGEAPDPATVSGPCPLVGPNSHDESINSLPIRNCVVSLDANAFENVTITDSVVQYRGGPVSLRNVRFVNCLFELRLATPPVAAPSKDLILALLGSSNQQTIEIAHATPELR